MKKMNILWLLASACTILLTGCKDDEPAESAPRNTGDEIVFGARAGFENGDAKTRTEYTGETYPENGKTYEKVNWTDGDVIRIFCEQAYAEGGKHWVDYNVTGINSSNAHLEKHAGEGAGLQWGSNTEAHTFYALYPSPVQYDNDDQTSKTYVNIDQTMVKGYLPPTQAPKEITKTADNNWNVQCDMRYAFMTAKTVVAAGAGGNGVQLSFQPITTAVEIEIKAPANQPIELSQISIVSNTNKSICGQFSCDMTQIDANGYPICSEIDNDATVTQKNRITVPLWYNDNGTQKPLSLNGGQSIKVTIFLLPIENLSDLRFEANFVGAVGTKKKTLTGVTLNAHKKHYIKGLQLPATGNVNNWISTLDPNIYISQLSIPGTGNSFSHYYNSTTPEYYQEQTKTVTEQWNTGIRCFELVSDRGGSNDNLATQLLRCNSAALNSTTFQKAVEELIALLQANKNEFLIIMPMYQPGGADSGSRDITIYMNNLNKFYTETLPGLLSGTDITTAQYHPGMTIGEARGKIMFIARVGSEGEDNDATINALAPAGNMLVVKGWGSLKDKWHKRGYPVNAEYKAYNDQNMEYHITAQNSSSTPQESHFKPVPTVTSAADFTYRTNTNYTVWAQEWARVSPSNIMKQITRKGNIITGYSYMHVRWFESMAEKKEHIETTFQKSVNDKANVSTIYVNSLCGYYVTNDYAVSYTPYMNGYEYNDSWGGSDQCDFGSGGMGGDIVGFSADINNWFYNHILEKGVNNITGPMGIIMLDRVGESDGGKYLPQVVIDNNFKFELVQKQSDSAIEEGGNAI